VVVGVVEGEVSQRLELTLHEIHPVGVDTHAGQFNVVDVGPVAHSECTSRRVAGAKVVEHDGEADLGR
jgi:hypothetical protein